MILRRFAMLVLALLVTGCATHAATSGRIVLQDRNAQVAVTINDRDRAVIDEYYGKRKAKGLPPGLAKRTGRLPPGLAKREKLPPGLHGDALPRELEQRLTLLPKGYLRMRVGHDIVLIDGRTRVVIDLVYGVAI